jgi:hypothetical protein
VAQQANNTWRGGSIAVAFETSIAIITFQIHLVICLHLLCYCYSGVSNIIVASYLYDDVIGQRPVIRIIAF